MSTTNTCTQLGNGRCDVYTPGDLEASRRERLTRHERDREAGLPLPDEEVDAHQDRGGLDPSDLEIVGVACTATSCRRIRRHDAAPQRTDREVAR